MENYVTARDGDLALVAEGGLSPIIETTEFQVATFPETVVLDETFTSSIEVGLQPADGSWVDCYGEFNSNGFSIDLEANNGNYSINYTSSDGITYTRTQLTGPAGMVSGNRVDFGSLMKYGSMWGMSEWDDAVGKFILVGSATMSGFYVYNMPNFVGAPTQLTAINDYVMPKNYMGKNSVVEVGTLNQTTNLNVDQLKLRLNLRELYANMSASNISNWFSGRNTITTINLEEEFYDVDISNVTNMAYTFNWCRNLVTLPNIDTKNVTNMHYMLNFCGSYTAFNYNTSNVIDMSYMFAVGGIGALTTAPDMDTSNVTNMEGMFQTASKLQHIPNYNTAKVTTMSYMLWHTSNLLDVPNLDMSNVTNISHMFDNCYKLINIPNFNTIKVTNMHSTFMNCWNLTTLPNLIYDNVSDDIGLVSTFNNCVNLSGSINMSLTNVIRLHDTFNNCRKITTVSLYNTDNMRLLFNVFTNCINLVEITEFNMSGVKEMRSIFQYCNKLSNNAVQNIINSILTINPNSSNVVRNLSTANIYSIFYNTNIKSSRYSNRLTELTQAGWSY